MPSKQEDHSNSTRILLGKAGAWALVIMLQSVISMAWLLLIPKEPGNAVLLGYSLRRLALLIPMSLPLLAGVILWISARKNARWLQTRFTERHITSTASILVLGGALLAAGVWSFVFLFFFLEFFPDLGAYLRLMPWLVSYFLLGLEAVLFVPLFMFSKKKSAKPVNREKFPIKAFLIAFFVLVAVFVLIEATGLGKNPQRFSIITLGVPLLEGQIWYITGLLALILLTAHAWQFIPAQSSLILHKRGDLIIAALLWLAAVVLWMSLPLPSHNYFAPAVQPPNFEKYPFSDAEQYDLNSLFVYYGSLDDFVVSKPMYVSLLTILHAIGGLSYANIVLLQTLIVALFPPVLYLIGRELHSRLGGIAIALFAIFREVSSIQYGSVGNVANTKLLLSDMPAALLAAVLALTLIRWFKRKEKDISGHEFIIGGLIGVFALVRIQTILLIPAAMITVIFRYAPKFKTILVSALILLAAFALVVAPVLIRNHAITGVFWLDNPSSSAPLSRILTEGLDSFEEQELLKGGDEVVNQNVRIYLDLLFNNFGFFISFVLDHFARNIISSFLILPIRLGNGEAFLEFLTFGGYFWGEVYSLANTWNLLVVIINLLLISLGISIIYSKNLKGLLLLIGFFLYYNLTSSIARLSGWRFILPVDWVLYTLFAVGLIEVLSFVFKRTQCWIHDEPNPWLTKYSEAETKGQIHLSWPVFYGLIFLFSGAFIPAREHLLPSLVPVYSTPEVCERLDTALVDYGYDALRGDFMDFCLSENTRVLQGFGIYPRYFKSGEGYYDRSYDPWFGKQDFARLAFRLIGTRSSKVYIKTETDNLRFSNGAMVYLAGRDKIKFEAQFVLVDGPEPELIIAEPILTGEEALDLIY